MPRLRRALAALFLSAPLTAQVVRVAAPTPIFSAPVAAPAAPAAVLSAAAVPILTAPSAALAAPLVVLAAPPAVLAAAAPAAPAAAPAAPAAAPFFKKKDSPALAAAKRSPVGRALFDGSIELETRSGSVFVPSREQRPEVPGGFAFIRARPAPAAPVRPVPDTQGLSGRRLLERVGRIAGQGHFVHPYRDASRYLFSTADNHAIGGVHGVADAYSGVFSPGTSGAGQDYAEPDDADLGGGAPRAQTMNVEHVFPQSYFKHELPMRSDLHHLMATFAGPNEIRGNLPYGVVKGRPDYRNEAGAKRGGGVFEPPDFTKGRVARAMLYFYASYYKSSFFDSETAAFWNSQIETLLDWNRRFPPTVEEVRRNDQVEAFQGNRNPFVDDPGLANRIGAPSLRDFRASDAKASEQGGGQVPRRRSDKPRKGDRRGSRLRQWFGRGRGRR